MVKQVGDGQQQAPKGAKQAQEDQQPDHVARHLALLVQIPNVDVPARMAAEKSSSSTCTTTGPEVMNPTSEP